MSEPRRSRGTLARVVAVGALALGTLGLATAPATAATGTLTVSATTVSAGVPITATYAQGSGYQGASTMVTLTASRWNGTQQIIQTIGTQPLQPANIGGVSTVFHFPLFSSGTFTLTATPDGWADSPVSQQITVTNVQTFTRMTAVNTARVSSPNNITATVTSASPSVMRPAGTVTFLNVSGQTVATVNLLPGSGTGQSVATWVWTPNTVGTFIFSARFNPASGNPSITSGSSAETILVTQSGSPISLILPPQLAVGTPVNLVAQLSPPTLQGSVGFTYNGKPISASVPIVNGQASFVWTPPVQGQAIMGANFTTNAGQTGSTSDVVQIGAISQRDAVTLTQPGFGTWAPGGVYPLANGTSFTFQASSASGAPVTLTDTGPCNVTGLDIEIDTGSGQCNLVASTPGANGYAPVSQGYTVAMVPGQQTLLVQPPLSGRVNKGRTIRLEGPGQGDTNAGQNVVWKVREGKSVCKLRFPSSGAVNLRTVKKGTCTVRGTAPAVPGQWNRFVINRTYRVR